MKTLPCVVLCAMGAALLSCGPDPAIENEKRLAQLRSTYNGLHQRLEAASAKDPLVASAFADRGSVVVAIRSSLIEELAGNIAKRYLDDVTVDLHDVKARGRGEVRRKTFLGRVKVGSWNVNVELGGMIGDLRAGTPRVSLRAPNMIDLEIPVDVLETTGEATLDFGWDSAGIANVVCKDFTLNRGIEGRVLPQKHTLKGAMRLENTGTSLTATPIFPNRKIHLRLDLTEASWAVVALALESQNTAGTCGALMKPEQALQFLKDLAAKGVGVRLPRSIFRTVSLPARLRQEVTVNRRVLNLAVNGESLRIDGATLWSSASVHVQTAPATKAQAGGSF